MNFQTYTLHVGTWGCMLMLEIILIIARDSPTGQSLGVLINNPYILHKVYGGPE